MDKLRQTRNMFGGDKKDNSITATDSSFITFGKMTHTQQNRKSLYASADLLQHFVTVQQFTLLNAVYSQPQQ